MNYKQKKNYFIEYTEIANNMLFDIQGIEKEKNIHEYNSIVLEIVKKYVESYPDHFSQTPEKLYKYRSFDAKGYTFDMLENKYLYLAPMTDLDDSFEATINNGIWSKEDLIKTLYSEITYSKLVRAILLKYNAYSKKALDYFSFDKFNDMPGDLKRSNSISLASYNYLSKKHNLSNEEIFRINSLIKYWIYSPDFIQQSMKLIHSYIDTREKTGVCSLATSFQNYEMWRLYADNNEGCCIEYEFNKNDVINFVDVVPVLYKDNRNYDTVDFLVDCYVESFDRDFKVFFDKAMAQFRVIANTKDKKWEYQDEWRIIGEPKKKSPAPRISAIYLRNNISKENMEMIRSLINGTNTCVYQLDEHLNIIYRTN